MSSPPVPTVKKLKTSINMSSTPSPPPPNPTSSKTAPKITPHSIDTYVVNLPSNLRQHLSNHFSDVEINRIQGCYKLAPTRTVFRQVTPCVTGQVPPSPATPDFTLLPVPESAVTALPQIPSVYLTSPPTTSTTPTPCPSFSTASSSLLTSPTIIVDRICAEAVLRGSTIFNPGILASNGDIVKGCEVYVWGDVTEPGGAGKTEGGKDKKNNRGCKIPHFQGDIIYLGIGCVEVSKQSDFFRLSTGTGVTMISLVTGSTPMSLNELDTTKWFCQNLPSLVPAYSLSQSITDSNALILDMCSAPGGKTSHIAGLSKGSLVFANDRSKKKMIRVRKLMKKQGFDNVKCISADATKLCSETENTNTEIKSLLSQHPPNPTTGLHTTLKTLPPSSFTHILLDPPCSALGLRPRLHIPDGDDVKQYSVYQRGFVDQAIKLLKPGGTLCYSTCTYNPEENEGVTAFILEKYKEMELVDVGVGLGKMGVEWEGLTEEDRRKVRRFDWCDEEEGEDMAGSSIGFFVARFVKNK